MWEVMLLEFNCLNILDHRWIAANGRISVEFSKSVIFFSNWQSFILVYIPKNQHFPKLKIVQSHLVNCLKFTCSNTFLYQKIKSMSLKLGSTPKAKWLHPETMIPLINQVFAFTSTSAQFVHKNNLSVVPQSKKQTLKIGFSLLTSVLK